MIGEVFDWDDLLRLSPTLNPVLDDYVLIIDDFYEDPDRIYDYLMCANKPMWKFNPEDPQCKNGRDYHDCRTIDRIGHPSRIYWMEQERLLDQCRKHFWKGEYRYTNYFEVNCFQTNNIFDQRLQHYPHVDEDLAAPNDYSTLNMLVYLDKEEDGGTAVYDGQWINNNESQNLLYPVEDVFNIERVIPHKYNRCVIFPGNRIHGAYIEDYSKYTDDKWRFTQVVFYHPAPKQPFQ